ncbi:MAG: hypothetical protein Q4B48_08670 [Syntrophomonadaceae bacterium]|nr:hypothetical protein [Syntrophomonadaceae bacterium]
MRRSLSLFIAFMLLAALPGLALAAPGESLSPIAGNPQPADGPGTGGTGGSSTGGAVAATGDAPASTGRLAGQLQRFIAAQNNEKKAILYTGYVIQPDSVTLKIHKQFHDAYPSELELGVGFRDLSDQVLEELNQKRNVPGPASNGGSAVSDISISTGGVISNTDPNSTLLITTEASESDLADLGLSFGAGVVLNAGVQQSTMLSAEAIDKAVAELGLEETWDIIPEEKRLDVMTGEINKVLEALVEQGLHPSTRDALPDGAGLSTLYYRLIDLQRYANQLGLTMPENPLEKITPEQMAEWLPLLIEQGEIHTNTEAYWEHGDYLGTLESLLNNRYMISGDLVRDPTVTPRQEAIFRAFINNLPLVDEVERAQLHGFLDQWIERLKF